MNWKHSGQHRVQFRRSESKTLKFTFSFRKFILGLQHSLGPKYLDPLVVPIGSEPVEIDRGDGPRGEGHGDLDVVVVVDRRNLGNEAGGA